MIDRIVSPLQENNEEPKEAEVDNNLRPKDFSNYIGQERLKKNLQLSI